LLESRIGFIRSFNQSAMDNRPKALTKDEINEIASIEAVQEMWGATNIEEMTEQLRQGIYAVKFDFVSGSPGYVGDLYILIGDTFDEPVRLIRVDGKLEVYG
jgi:hypothetical protein